MVGVNYAKKQAVCTIQKWKAKMMTGLAKKPMVSAVGIILPFLGCPAAFGVRGTG